MRALTLIAILSVLPGCWARDPTTQTNSTTTTNAAGVKSMELTAPWKDMNLSSIEGGVVVASLPNRLLVRFPATPADVFGGLYENLKGELVAAGWSFTEERRFDSDIKGVFSTSDGKRATLIVDVSEGRPEASFAILD